MASQATITGKIGPAKTLTASVFSNVTSFSVVTGTNVMALVSEGRIFHIDIGANTTFTISPMTTGAYAITVSA